MVAGALAIVLALLAASRLKAQDTPPAAATPSSRIDLGAIGYHEPSRMDRLAEAQPSVSLDFVDSDHVLLTFNRKGLFKRLPGCSPDHEDRLMHAVILEIPTGKITKEADWYLHDRRRYLWPLGSGRFLLRRLNDLYLVDADLHEKLLMASPKPLLWVSVTPEGSQVILETENDRKSANSALRQAAKPEPKYVVRFLDVKTLALQRTLLLNNFTHVTGTSSGYADVIRRGDVWLVRFGPSAIRRNNLARVRSRTTPDVLYPTENTLLVGRCAVSSCPYGVSAFTLTGHRLWRQRWPNLRSYPEIARSEDNRRFGVSTVRVEPDAAPVPQPEDEQDNPLQPFIAQRDVFRQEIQVFDTASGNSVLSISVTPAVTTGQNFSLSSDGRRLALLRASALELFDLPPMSAEEQTRFASLQADISGLYRLGSDDTADSTMETAAVASNSEDAADVTADAPASATKEEIPDSQATAQPAEGSGQPVFAVSDSPRASTAGDPSEKREPAASVAIPTFKVSTKAVVVDVVVTDSKGRPVRDLHQQDFQLTEDNRPQGIRYFREFSDLGDPSNPNLSGLAATNAASATHPSASPASAAAPSAPSRNVFNNHVHSSQAGAVTLVLFDMLNTPPQDQAYASQQLIKFLKSKPKTSQFALCTLSPGEYPLRLIQGFTDDETLLLAAAKGKKAQARESRWQASEREVQNSLATVGDLAAAGGRTSGFQNLTAVMQEMQAEQQVTDTVERAGRTIDGMMLLARYLSGISGRKNIVWLSASFPVAISASPVTSNPSVDNPNFTYKIKRATNLLADAQVAVYPVDVRGLQTYTLSAGNSGISAPASFEPPGPSSGNLADFAVPSTLPQAVMDFSQMASEQDTMTQFAVATGGRAFLNTNGISEAIATANEQGSNYYSLSYSPSNKVYDGKFRKIKVQLAQKGYKLYYRQGYYADEVNVAAKEAELARRAVATAMHYGSPPAREVQFSVRVYPVGGKKKVDRAKIGEVLMASTKKMPPLPSQVEVQHYVIDYTLDGSELRFVPRQNASLHNSLALMVTSFGNEGRMLTGLTSRATSDLKPDVYNKIITGEVGFQEEVDVPVEAISMRLGIEDQMSNHLGTVDVPLPVPPDPTAPHIARNKLPEIEPD